MSQRIETHGEAIKELSQLISALLAAARSLPPGPERQAALKQIGMFQVKLDRLAARSALSLAKSG
jgi:hypothetical protein